MDLETSNAVYRSSVVFRPLLAIQQMPAGEHIPVEVADDVYDMLNQENVIVGSILLLNAVQDCERLGWSLFCVSPDEIEVVCDGVGVGWLILQHADTVDMFDRSLCGVE